MAAAYLPLGTAETLKQQVVSVALDRAFLADPLPTDAAGFARRVEEGRGRLSLIAQEVARQAGVILTEFAIASRKVKDSKFAPDAVPDITQQLQRLVPRDFLLQTTWTQLHHLPRYLKAMRLRATVGEVSDALEKIFGRFRANNQTISGVYGGVVQGQESWEQIKADVAKFAEEEGRRPRIMIAKLGQDGHDRGAKVVASAFADLGFDIDIGPLFQTPEEAARHAVENDVHAVGCSSLAAGHKTLVPAIIKALKDQGADDIITFVGGVIPAQDYEALYQAGAAGIFGPGTPIQTSAREVLKQIRAARKA